MDLTKHSLHKIQAQLASTFWYEDPSTVGVPDMTFGAVSPPGSPTLSYSSYVPHYTEASGNAFSYQIYLSLMQLVTCITVIIMYYSLLRVKPLDLPDQMHLNFSMRQVFLVYRELIHHKETGEHQELLQLITATHVPRNVHATITSNHFHRWDCITPYGSDLNERATVSQAVNIMGTTADFTNNVDEDAIECTVGSLTGGSATRVKAGASGDTPSPTFADLGW